MRYGLKAHVEGRRHHPSCNPQITAWGGFPPEFAQMCVCVCAYVYIYIPLSLSLNISMYIYICIYIYIHMYISIHTYVYIYIYTHTILVYVYTPLYMYIYICVHVYDMYVYIYIYTSHSLSLSHMGVGLNCCPQNGGNRYRKPCHHDPYSSNLDISSGFAPSLGVLSIGNAHHNSWDRNRSSFAELGKSVGISVSTAALSTQGRRQRTS